MASSRRSASSLEQTLAEALAGGIDGEPRGPAGGEEADTPMASGARPPSGERWLVAYSGGLDSTVLLHAVVQFAGAKNVVATHVHHGLQPAADAWAAHCEAQAHEFGAAFECVRLSGSPARGQSLEAWARDERYRALAGVARRQRCAAVLTAHHADDQVETVLMRIARGTGIDGLAGIEPATRLAGAVVLRPLLGLRRARLAAYGRRHGLRWVEDPSNADQRRARNAIRHRVLPAIDASLPDFRGKLLDALPLVRAARDAQVALAAQDLELARSGTGLDRRVLVQFSLDRRNAALRAWLRSQGLRAPSEARLREIGKQLIEAQGADGRVLHDGYALLRHRDTIVGCGAEALAVEPLARTELSWRGEGCIELPAGAGRLRFVAAGADAADAVAQRWLSAQTLVVSPGGASAARLRPHPLARRRTLKNLYQERGVPAWMRATLPLVHASGQLLYASGIGMDCDADRPREGDCVSLRWEPAAHGDPRWAWCEESTG
jgi:tRNA(Ile)-lysidine synthase